MAEPVFEEGEVYVRNVRTEDEDNGRGKMVESLTGLGRSFFRLGKSVFLLGTSIIPQETSTHFRNGLRESIYAAASLPRDVVDVVGERAEKWRKKHEKERIRKAPNDEIIEIKSS